MDEKKQWEYAVFGGGCFWCLEELFSGVRGIEEVVSGYAGGLGSNPSYQEVCTGDTGHAEVVRIIFDPSKIKYENLLELFFVAHDPTTLNRQGNDVGTQYRSIIVAQNDGQEKTARESMDRFQKEGWYEGGFVTEIVRGAEFFPAEEEHQRYYKKHPEAGYCQLIISPKLAKVRAKYQSMFR